MKIKKIVWLVVAGVLIRILASALLYHTDVKAIYRDARSISGGVAQAYRIGAANKNPLPYPPLVYVFFNFYQSKTPILFSGHFSEWMNDWSTLHTENHPKIFQDLFAMKFPMLLADLAAVS